MIPTRRILIAALVTLAAVIFLAGTAHAASSSTRPVVQTTCKAGRYPTWKVTSSKGTLRSTCASSRPITGGVDYGAGMVYAPVCPHGMRAELTAVGTRAAARCKASSS